MEKYSWSFRRDDAIWDNDSHDTIEECISAAREDNRMNGYGYTKVYIGENAMFIPRVDAEAVLEALEMDGYDFCGEAADSWESFDPKQKEELEELSMALTTVVTGWLAKYAYAPTMCQVDHVIGYDLNEEQGGDL